VSGTARKSGAVPQAGIRTRFQRSVSRSGYCSEGRRPASLWSGPQPLVSGTARKSGAVPQAGIRTRFQRSVVDLDAVLRAEGPPHCSLGRSPRNCVRSRRRAESPFHSRIPGSLARPGREPRNAGEEVRSDTNRRGLLELITVKTAELRKELVIASGAEIGEGPGEALPSPALPVQRHFRVDSFANEYPVEEVFR